MGQLDIVAILVFEFTGRTNMLVDANTFPSFRTVFLDIDEVDGSILEFTTEEELWDPGDWDPETGEFDNPWIEFLDDNSDDAGIFIEDNSITWGWFPSLLPGDEVGGMFPGLFYQYTVRPLLVQRNREGLWRLRHDTEFSTVPNQVVAVAPAYTAATHAVFGGMDSTGVYEVWSYPDNPEVDIGTGMATFYFYYPFGADEIVLQVSRDPNVRFAPPGVTNISVLPQLPDPFGPDNREGPKSSVTMSLSTVPGVGAFFWWRIGARNSADTYPPRTLPIGDPYDSGFTWSARSGFVLPTVSRAELMHEQREALSAARAAAARVPRAAAADRVLRAE
jgi:hypothetical protein